MDKFDSFAIILDFPIHLRLLITTQGLSINQYFENIWITFSCAWLLTSTCIIAHKRIKLHLLRVTQSSVTDEELRLKVKSEHRDCIIGQIIGLPAFLLFLLVVTEIS